MEALQLFLMASIKLIVIATIAESVWDATKVLWKPGSKDAHVNAIGALAIGLLIAFITNINIFAIAGIPIRYEIVGVLLTGIMISRGSAFVHDALTKIEKILGNKK